MHQHAPFRCRCQIVSHHMDSLTLHSMQRFPHLESHLPLYEHCYCLLVRTSIKYFACYLQILFVENVVFLNTLLLGYSSILFIDLLFFLQKVMYGISKG